MDTVQVIDEESLVRDAGRSAIVQRLVGLARWAEPGRALTTTGRVKLADAKTLVALLDTGDTIDPRIGDRVFRTKTSEELYGLSEAFAWARAAGLVRVTGSRLIPVKARRRLLDRSLDLWDRAFEVFPSMGKALCGSGWGESILRAEFEPAMTAVLARLYGGPLTLAATSELAWETVSWRYAFPGGPELPRRVFDRDVRHAVEVLKTLGAVRVDQASGEPVVELTRLGRRGMRRRLGEAGPGEPVYQVRVTLLEVDDPSVWRELLVSAGIHLDRLHVVLQATMGWTNSHLHAFSVGDRRFGDPDPELELEDERAVRVADLVSGPGARIGYEYDFGDGWEHEIVVQEVRVAEADLSYPVCLAGQGACPPEDCGGPPGYRRMREALADLDDPEHDEFRTWLGLEDGDAGWSADRFEIEAVNRTLTTIHR